MILPAIRILKSSGLRSLRKKLRNTACRVSIVSDILEAFGSVRWCDALDLKDINSLWSRWVTAYIGLINKLIGTRLARESFWGR